MFESRCLYIWAIQKVDVLYKHACMQGWKVAGIIGNWGDIVRMKGKSSLENPLLKFSLSAPRHEEGNPPKCVCVYIKDWVKGGARVLFSSVRQKLQVTYFKTYFGILFRLEWHSLYAFKAHRRTDHQRNRPVWNGWNGRMELLPSFQLFSFFLCVIKGCEERTSIFSLVAAKGPLSNKLWQLLLLLRSCHWISTSRLLLAFPVVAPIFHCYFIRELN